jgi:hypothetical protein
MNDAIQPFYNSEWFSTLLKRTRARPLGVVLIVVGIYIAVEGTLATLTRTWTTGPSGMGLLSDYQTLASVLLFQPVVFATFCWLPHGVQKLFEQVIAEGALEQGAELQQSLEALHKRLRNRWLPVAAALWSLISCAIEAAIFFLPVIPSWVASHPAHFWVNLPLHFIFFYVLTLGFYDFLVVLIGIDRVFRRHRIRVQALHPDRAGGLGAIGRFTANIGYSAGAIGLFLAIILLQKLAGATGIYNLLRGAIFAVYLCMAPLGFYFPLWSAHASMRTVRERLLKDVSSEFDGVFSRLHALRPENADQAEPLLKRLRQLDEERELVNRFPVWPFDTASLRKFFGLALSPLIPIVTSLLINLLSRIF